MPQTVVFKANSTKENVTAVGLFVGQAILKVNGSSAECSDVIPDIGDNTTQSKIEIYVVHSYAITILSEVIGWIYFVAWSVSFYPQVFLNFRRKSVVGLNFDFLALNITGFLAYSIYNIALFWIPKIQMQYNEKHPDGINPVQINDVVFAVHAVTLTAITIIQAAIYERAGQRVSRIVIGLLSVIGIGSVTLLFVAVGNKISWLTFINILSYVKLGITLIKYVPQALMNFRRKSTVGWSIGNVLLDFTGGSFSILQMILQSYNNHEWDLVFGDPTKFGLGLFSVLFDILFMVQHYILYNPKRRKMVDEDESLIHSDSDNDKD